MTKQREIKHRNMVAKHAREFNKCLVELSKKQKLKHKKPKHKKDHCDV